MDCVMENSLCEFSAKFCNALDRTKNAVFSPLAAAELTMAMVTLGSVDLADPVFSDYIQTYNENIIPPSFLSLSRLLKSIKGVTLNKGSKVYLNKNIYKLNRNLKVDAMNIFNVKIKEVDFSASDVVAKRINDWIEKKSNKKSNTLFDCNSFNTDTEIVLVSCLYFKGTWHMKFDPENTEETLFYLNSNETVNVFLMYRRENYKYKDSKALDAQLLLLPFKNEEAHMLVILPKRVNGLDEVIQKLADGYNLMAELNECCTVDVKVSIPRFNIECETNLSEVLTKLGTTTSFDVAVQKVRIEVNEDGTEPKPVPMKSGFIPRWKPRPYVFTADRPHLIVILCHNIPIIWVTFRGKFD